MTCNIIKVAVITRHAITNYGSLLQVLATQQVIEGLGYSCEIIDYIRDDESYMQHEKTILSLKQYWNKNLFKKAIYLAIRQPASIASGIRFKKMQRKYLNLSVKYTTVEQLINCPPEADIFITGSDQVWGPTENGTYDSSYCLSFTDKKKIAFASSFGISEITKDVQNYFKKYLQKYDKIAVREDSAVRILDDMGIIASQVLDPTLLLDASYWSQYCEPIKQYKYVLVYQLHNDKKLGDYACRVAKSKGLPLVRISTSFHQVVREGKFLWCPNIGTFLSYIKNADCLITDSFHGTAFAINFQTPFVEVLPNNSTCARNKSILKLLGLSDRILKDFTEIDLARREIDFSKVEKKLILARSRSINILKGMLS